MSLFACVALIPLCIAILGLTPRTVRWLPRGAAVLMVGQFFWIIWLCLPTLRGEVSATGDFGLDGVGALFLIITTLVVTAAMGQAALLLPAERAVDRTISVRRLGFFYTLAGFFTLAMYCVLLAQNVGYMWIAMETTTLMSVPLVYYHRSRKSLEAAWKYLLLCSVGIAFALFGTVLIAAAQHGIGGSTMNLGGLLSQARLLDPRLLRLGFIFCLLGYGTKAGLFPLHNWLPDAHSEAPAPASAMLSGALLNCALVAIWRLSGLMSAAGQQDLVRHLLVPAGAITVLAASLMLIRQHDLKRMWAYSSVEHVGLLTLAIGINAGPIFALHAFNHSLIKTALFLLSGNILYLYGTKTFTKLGGLLKTVPSWGLLFMAATFAVAGSPPFGTFISEWLLLRDSIAAGEIAAVVLVVIGLTVTFVALTSHMGRVLFGRQATTVQAVAGPKWAVVPAILVALSLLTGLALAPSVMASLTALFQVGGAR